MPRKVPMISGRGVSSRRCIPAGIYGRKFARNGLSGLNPIRSGNSCAAAASLALMFSLDISVTSDQFLQSGELVKGKDRGTLHAAMAQGQEIIEAGSGSIPQIELVPQGRMVGRRFSYSPLRYDLTA